MTLRAAGNKLTGTVGQVKVAGERPPTWGACDANASHAFGKPVTLFDGKSLDAWGVQMKDRPIGWSIEDGVMTNEPKANNLVSKEKFRDFRLDAEYKLSEKGNSGIYLRGRYEMQVLDDFGRTDDREHGHMSIYARQGADGERQQEGRRVADRPDHPRRQLRDGDAERPDRSTTTRRSPASPAARSTRRRPNRARS